MSNLICRSVSSKIFLYLLLMFLSIRQIKCSNCKNNSNLLDTECYNDLITFDKYRAGHACTNNKGIMIVEFSQNPDNSKSRLFYGLKPNGRYYFPDESGTKIIEEMACEGCDANYKGRFESRNLFVSLKDDSQKSKQYLFSMSSFHSLTELHDIENDQYFAWNTTYFFGLEKQIFSYEYSLFEIQNTNTYIIAVVESAGKINDNEYAEKYTLRKFQFGSFSSSPYIELASLKESDKYDDRAISAFYLPIPDLIVLFFLKFNVGYAALFYDTSFTKKGEIKFSDADNPWKGWGLYNKAIHIKDNYAAFVYFSDGNSQSSLKFRFMSYKNDYDFEDKITRDFSDYNFRQDVQANGFYKLTDERIVLFTEEEGWKTLHMFLFDFYDNYAGIKIREYKFSYTGKRFIKEMASYMYNGYILFSATISEPVDVPEDTTALMMIFGFANGTDATIDISPYLMDTNYYNAENNLYKYLIETMKIDNNIFGYEKIEKIRLISICDELLLYRGKLNIDKEDSALPLNELFDENITLLQNKQIQKEENKLYTLEYQFMVKEPDFDTFYSSAHNVIDDKLNSVDASNLYKPKTLDGRVNILKFKLCHKFCINCIEYGPSDNDQRCINCKSTYINECVNYNPQVSTIIKDIDTTSTILKEPSTEIPKEDLTTILTDICQEESKISENCRNLTNQELYEGIYEEILSNFPPNGESKVFNGKNGYSFQVTTSGNELDALNAQNNVVITLDECEEKLRQANQITGNLPLIIFKVYKESSLSKDKDVQFEVYDPYTYKKLNLSVCKNIDMHIQVNLTQDNQIYKDIVNQGYDPFDINDKFYREICTQYDSENGTDVLLDAREEYYYSPIVNETSCQENCHYSSYSLDTKYLTCECETNNDGIVTFDEKHLDAKNVVKSFYSSLKLSNYKVVICYNLVFNFKVFCHNYGSIITSIFFILYVICLIVFAIKNIKSLKISISKLLFLKEGVDNIIKDDIKKFANEINSSKKEKKKNKKNKNKNDKALPPKKSEKQNRKKIFSDIEFNDIKSSKAKMMRLKKKENELITDDKLSSKRYLKNQEISELPTFNKSKIFKTKEQEIKNGKKDDEKLDPDSLDNYEINNLEYIKACEYDKRSFCKTYISVLLREQLLLFTFFSCKDYNLFVAKFARFLVLICTNMSMTALFFFHKTMYKKQDIEENWGFWQKFLQTLFVLIVYHIIEVYLCSLSLTDKNIYKIKSLSKKPINNKKIIDIIECIKRKLIIFFISTFILFLIFWYFISAFCAVYQNTQIIFLKESAISFGVALLDPFVSYGLIVSLRKISLSTCCRKKAGCLYKASNIFPLF